MRRHFFGQFLLSKGLITPPQLLAAVEYQDKYNSRLGELAVALSMVTPFEAQQINSKQVREDRLFGQAAIELGLLSEQQVCDVLATQRDSHVLLGQAIVTLGYVAAEVIDSALAEFLDEASHDPDGIQLPAEVPDRELAAALFDLAQKLLLRAWDLTSKPGPGRVEAMRLTLSDRNARVELDGSLPMTVLIGVPNDVIAKLVRHLATSTDPTESDEDQLVLEFGQLLGENLAVALAERGQEVHVSHVTSQGARATLPPEVKVTVVPYLTHGGQVLIGLRL
ncbi:MAG TPA: hypothetical protein VF331_25145 [Polyangiales bacterium]